MKNEIEQHEMYIRIALLECTTLMKLLNRDIYKHEGHYFFALFSIYFRQLIYYFSETSSPFIDYRSKFTVDEKKSLDKMTDFRNASSHLNDKVHVFSNNVTLTNAFNFKDNDVQIQFGVTQLFLLKEIIPLYEKVVKVLGDIPDLYRTFKSPMRKIEYQNILEAKEDLKKSLSRSSEELRKKRPSILSH